MSKHRQNDGTGYEYRVVGRCPHTGRPVVAPIAWNSVAYPNIPFFATCVCCRPKR